MLFLTQQHHYGALAVWIKDKTKHKTNNENNEGLRGEGLFLHSNQLMRKKSAKVQKICCFCTFFFEKIN